MSPEWVRIPAAPSDGFVTKVINDTFYPVYIDSDRGSLPVPTPALNFAEQIVNDYVQAQFGKDVELDAQPGIFAVEGEHDAKSIQARFPHLLKKAKEQQIRWFSLLVQKADEDWVKSHQHNHISNMQRIAAKELGLERDWMFERALGSENVKCPACGSTVPNTAICANCKCILDAEAAAKLTFAK